MFLTGLTGFTGLGSLGMRGRGLGSLREAGEMIGMRRRMRLKSKVGFFAAVVLFVVVAVFFSKRREAVVLPLSFAGFTNVGGEASALFRFELPAPRGFLNRQWWMQPTPEIAWHAANGRRVTNSPTLKPADLQTFPSATNVTFQIRIGVPTNATGFAVDYSIRLKEGFSVGSLDLYFPIEKAILYRSGEVAVTPGAELVEETDWEP
jgi:hypothetical protein